jgi:hypothetical protein
MGHKSLLGEPEHLVVCVADERGFGTQVGGGSKVINAQSIGRQVGAEKSSWPRIVEVGTFLPA